MVHMQFVCSRKEITGKKHTEPITTDKQCRGDSPSSGKSRGLLYVVSRSCDYGPFTLFAMAPERPRLMLQNPMFYCSHGLLLLLLSITAANLPRALFTGLDFWCCVSWMFRACILLCSELKGWCCSWFTVPRPGDSSVTPGTGSSSSGMLSLLSHRDATMSFEICFPWTFNWIKFSCCQISRVQHRGSAAKLIGGQEKIPWISAVTDPAYKRELSKLCTLVLPVERNNTDHPWLKPDALEFDSPKSKWGFCWLSCLVQHLVQDTLVCSVNSTVLKGYQPAWSIISTLSDSNGVSPDLGLWRANPDLVPQDSKNPLAPPTLGPGAPSQQVVTIKTPPIWQSQTAWLLSSQHGDTAMQRSWLKNPETGKKGSSSTLANPANMPDPSKTSCRGKGTHRDKTRNIIICVFHE